MAVSDIKISQRLAFLLESASVTIIVILCIAVYVRNGSVFDQVQLSLKGGHAGGIVVGMVLAIFAFVGFESAGSLGQEAREPSRSVPKAILLACLTAGSRMLLSLGHDGLLPKVFTHTSKHTHAPNVAIWVVAVPMTVIPAAYRT